MPETDKLALPYPDTNDLATVPAHIKDLAEAAEGEIVKAGAAKSLYIAATQTTDSTTPTLLGTPDRIEGIEVPAGGVLLAYFSAYRSGNSPGPASGTGKAFLYLDEVPSGASVTLSKSTSFGAEVRTVPGVPGMAEEDVSAGGVSGGFIILTAPLSDITRDVSVRWQADPGQTLRIGGRQLVVRVLGAEDVSP